MSHLECACSVTQSCLTLATPYSVARQTPLSLGFSRQEYWSGLPFPCPGDLPNPVIEPGSPALQADSLLTELGEKPYLVRLGKLHPCLNPTLLLCLCSRAARYGWEKPYTSCCLVPFSISHLSSGELLVLPWNPTTFSLVHSHFHIPGFLFL